MKRWLLWLIVGWGLFRLWPLLVGHFYLNVGLLQLSQLTLSEQETAVNEDHTVLVLQQAVAYLPERPSALRGLGLAWVRQGQEENAYPLWQQVPSLATQFALYGEQARQQGQYEDAYHWFEHAYQLQPTSGRYGYLTARMLTRLGAWEQAEAVYLKVISLDDFTEIDFSTISYHLGLLYQWQATPARMDEAETAYLEALEHHSFARIEDKADTYYRLGEIYEAEDRLWTDVLVWYEQAITLNPQHYWAQLRWGYALYRLSPDSEQGEQAIQKALVLWPEEPSRQWPYRFLGQIYQEQGRFEEAMTAYQAAARLAPDDEMIQQALDGLQE